MEFERLHDDACGMLGVVNGGGTPPPQATGQQSRSTTQPAAPGFSARALQVPADVLDAVVAAPVGLLPRIAPRLVSRALADSQVGLCGAEQGIIGVNSAYQALSH